MNILYVLYVYFQPDAIILFLYCKRKTFISGKQQVKGSRRQKRVHSDNEPPPIYKRQRENINTTHYLSNSFSIPLQHVSCRRGEQDSVIHCTKHRHCDFSFRAHPEDNSVSLQAARYLTCGCGRGRRDARRPSCSDCHV